MNNLSYSQHSQELQIVTTFFDDAPFLFSQVIRDRWRETTPALQHLIGH